MCGETKWRNQHFRPGDMIPVKASRFDGELPWNGFAQFEKLDYWKRQADATKCTLQLDSFTEGKEKNLYKIPEGFQMQGLIMNKDIEGIQVVEGDVKIVTRPPLTKHEQEIHSRWPYVVRKDDTGFSVKIWNKADVDETA